MDEPGDDFAKFFISAAKRRSNTVCRATILESS